MKLYSIFIATCLFIAVKAQKGDALLFFSLNVDATTDDKSLHGSCPVIEGEKWSATKWIHVRSFEKITRASGRDCMDENENCPLWAKRGECKKNPTYMVGSEGALGFCRKSCKDFLNLRKKKSTSLSFFVFKRLSVDSMMAMYITLGSNWVYNTSGYYISLIKPCSRNLHKCFIW